MKKYVQLTFVLLIIAVISGLVLGITNEVTKGPIEQVQLNKINKSMCQWFPEVPVGNINENAKADLAAVNDPASPLYDKNVIAVYNAEDKDGNLLGYVLKVKGEGSYGGGMTLLVGINLKGTVLGYTYATFNESGPGANVRNDKAFIKSIVGKTHDDLFTSDDHFKIDTVSGATYTSTATLNGISYATSYFDDHLKVETAMGQWFPNTTSDISTIAANTTPVVKGYKDINAIYNAVDTDGNKLGYVLSVKANGSFGDGMVMLVGIDTDGKVTGYTYTTFDESGSGIDVQTNTDFINAIVGKTEEQLFNQNGDSKIDTVSGATYTSNATLNGVKTALDYYNQNIKE